MNIWESLSIHQLGKHGEHLAKLEFTRHGFYVYTPEVDENGMDFIAQRRDGSQYHEIQVKSIRHPSKFISMQTKGFAEREHLYVALLIFKDEPSPEYYLIPARDWKDRASPLLVSRAHYKTPEWVMNLSEKNKPALQGYALREMIKGLI